MASICWLLVQAILGLKALGGSASLNTSQITSKTNPSSPKSSIKEIKPPTEREEYTHEQLERAVDSSLAASDILNSSNSKDKQMILFRAPQDPPEGTNRYSVIQMPQLCIMGTTRLMQHPRVLNIEGRTNYIFGAPAQKEIMVEETMKVAAIGSAPDLGTATIHQRLQISPVLCLYQDNRQIPNKNLNMPQGITMNEDILMKVTKENEVLKRSLKEQATRFQADLKRFTESSDAEINKVKDAGEKALQELSEFSFETLLSATESHYTELEKVQASHVSELAELRKKFESEISALKSKAEVTTMLDTPLTEDLPAHQNTNAFEQIEIEQAKTIEEDTHKLGMSYEVETHTSTEEDSPLAELSRRNDEITLIEGNSVDEDNFNPEVNEEMWSRLKAAEDALFQSINWDDEDYNETEKAMEEKQKYKGECTIGDDAGKFMPTYSQGALTDKVATTNTEVSEDYMNETMPEFCHHNLTTVPTIDHNSGSGIFGHHMEIAYFRCIFRTNGHPIDKGRTHNDYYRKMAVRNRILKHLPVGFGWRFNKYTESWDQVSTTVYRSPGVMGVKSRDRVDALSKLREFSY